MTRPKDEYETKGQKNRYYGYRQYNGRFLLP